MDVSSPPCGLRVQSGPPIEILSLEFRGQLVASQSQPWGVGSRAGVAPGEVAGMAGCPHSCRTA